MPEMEKLRALTRDMCSRPWQYKKDPFQIAEHVYYVGNSWVGSFLLTAGRDLLLIDCGYQECVYQLFESIHQLGYDPKNIRKLLITHGHADHCGAAKLIQDWSGCEVYFPSEDVFMLTERQDLVFSESIFTPFEISHTYRDDTPVLFGDFCIHSVHTPGHTPGTTSFFFTREGAGKAYRFGMHGGLGNNTLSPEFLQDSGLPLSLREEYLQSLRQMLEVPVDITLASHPTMQGRLFEDAEKTEIPIPERFCDRSVWEEMIRTRLEQFTA